MDIEIREFITYLHNTKKTSANTEISYQRDLKKMAEFLKDVYKRQVSKNWRIFLRKSRMNYQKSAKNTVSSLKGRLFRD